MTLTDYADLDGTEWGDAMIFLEKLVGYSEMYSDEFTNALEKEIADQLQYVKDNTRIVERTETFSHTVRDLEWD